jgi:hypothetical protein
MKKISDHDPFFELGMFHSKRWVGIKKKLQLQNHKHFTTFNRCSRRHLTLQVDKIFLAQ